METLERYMRNVESANRLVRARLDVLRELKESYGDTLTADQLDRAADDLADAATHLAGVSRATPYRHKRAANTSNGQ